MASGTCSSIAPMPAMRPSRPGTSACRTAPSAVMGSSVPPRTRSVATSRKPSARKLGSPTGGSGSPSRALGSKRRAGMRNGQDGELLMQPPVEEREVGHEEVATAEDEAGGAVEGVVARPLVLGDDVAIGREHRDLVRLVRADVEVAVDVEGDAIRTVEGAAGDAGREELDRAEAAVVESDAVDLVVRGVRHIEEALVAVEGDPVRAERREAVGQELTVRRLGLRAIGRDPGDAAAEGIRHVQVAG